MTFSLLYVNTRGKPLTYRIRPCAVGGRGGGGGALMAVWSKVLPLTASCPSTLPGFESLPGQVRKLPMTWG